MKKWDQVLSVHLSDAQSQFLFCVFLEKVCQQEIPQTLCSDINSTPDKVRGSFDSYKSFEVTKLQN